MRGRVLHSSFYRRPTRKVARELLGKFLVRRVRGETTALMITETEAYDGFNDKASHARHGKTPRNAPMFGACGVVYVYFTYGMHWMLNIVCGEEGYPAAVLIRGVDGISGPGRLTKALKIDKRLNGKKLSKQTGLWIEDRDYEVRPHRVLRTPRVGIAYAEEYAHKPWRFVFQNKKADTRGARPLKVENN